MKCHLRRKARRRTDRECLGGVYSVTCVSVHPAEFPSRQILSDGVYLELISFVHPLSHYPPGSDERHRRETSPWAEAFKRPGWIDYAFLGTGDTTISRIINERACADGSGAQYDPEVSGGRVREDGKVLQWMVTLPNVQGEEQGGRGTLPFFCGDVTPREWRVRS